MDSDDYTALECVQIESEWVRERERIKRNFTDEVINQTIIYLS